jgi:hypothetical protein
MKMENCKKPFWVWLIVRTLESLLVIPFVWFMMGFANGHFWAALTLMLLGLNTVQGLGTLAVEWLAPKERIN